jgi:hypothetical protein
MQKINKPDVVCEDPEEVSAAESCSEHVSYGAGPPVFPGEASLRLSAGLCWRFCV